MLTLHIIGSICVAKLPSTFGFARVVHNGVESEVRKCGLIDLVVFVFELEVAVDVFERQPWYGPRCKGCISLRDQFCSPDSERLCNLSSSGTALELAKDAGNFPGFPGCT